MTLHADESDTAYTCDSSHAEYPIGYVSESYIFCGADPSSLQVTCRTELAEKEQEPCF